MNLTDLIRITKVKEYCTDNLLELGLTSKLKLYTKIKEKISLSFDLTKPNPTTRGGKTIVTHQKFYQKHFERGSQIKLSKAAIQVLLDHEQLKGEQLSLVYAPGDNYQITSQSILASLNLRDVYVSSDEIINVSSHSTSNAATQRSGRTKDDYTQAIYLAIETLGVEVSTEKIFDWIHKKTEDFIQTGTNNEKCFNVLECTGDDLVPFAAASAKDSVIKKENGKTVTKATFGEACSRVKNKKRKK